MLYIFDKRVVNKVLIIIVFPLLFLAACGPSREDISTQTALFWTTTPIASYTPSMTPTITITYTPTVTQTFTETNTITITSTPSSTSTMTLTDTDTPTRSPKDRFIETSGEISFSYIPPVGWLESNRGNLTSWEFGEGMRPNTIGCELTFAIMLEPNVTAADFSIRYRGEVLGSGNFYTYAGYDAYRLSNINRATDGNGEDTFYFITNGKYFIIAGYNRMMGGYVEQNAIVDKSIMTIQFE